MFIQFIGPFTTRETEKYFIETKCTWSLNVRSDLINSVKSSQILSTRELREELGFWYDGHRLDRVCAKNRREYRVWPLVCQQAVFFLCLLPAQLHTHSGPKINKPLTGLVTVSSYLFRKCMWVVQMRET
jgi:hypothetical protein